MQIDKTTALDDIADKLVAIKDLECVIIVCLTKDKNTYICSSTCSREQQRLLAVETMRAGTGMFKDLALTCECADCKNNTKVH